MEITVIAAFKQWLMQLSSLLGRDVRQGFSLEEIIGIPCQVTITHYHVANGTYANINEVAPVNLDLETIKF